MLLLTVVPQRFALGSVSSSDSLLCLWVIRALDDLSLLCASLEEQYLIYGYSGVPLLHHHCQSQGLIFRH